MPTIVFVQPDGSRQRIEARVGQSIMEAATANLVPGIVADCGGGCSCATCHVYVDPEWVTKLEPADDIEQSMLEGAIEPNERSRLSCQLRMSDALDGIVVHVPAAQF
ncbi:2Fe-2S iron-sulfur cluster-binding protein [Sinimarinibacterium thermocellulolyticum]|uniref:2Fe-2S iron-sulfur cluster-binding protein n=1 Tax=Sinimarinibacterium thermocellulolyticum TaxID=3170016 RepID=A0ABV2A9Q9_9GAMM